MLPDAPMSDLFLLRAVRRLKRARVVIAPGLTPAEVAAIEADYGFLFPPDLRTFLQYALPISDDFIDWRRAPRALIHDRLTDPFDWLEDAVAREHLWLPAWGPRPTDPQVAEARALQAIAAAPLLIPIRGHRYLPSHPHEANNPVFSVHQTDIVYYGGNLFASFEQEFYRDLGAAEPPTNGPFKPIDLWSDLVAWGDGTLG